MDKECHREFFYNSTYDCCYNTIDIIVRSNILKVKPSFFLFGVGNVSVRQEWLILPKWHFHSDLGLYIEKDDSSNLSFSVSETEDIYRTVPTFTWLNPLIVFEVI